MKELKTYEVEYRSVPGMYAQYNGVLSVSAETDTDAEAVALSKLKRSFPDRDNGMWKILSIKREN